MKSELLRRSALARNYEHVHVAVAIAREGDPFSIRREARIDVASLVDGYAFDVAAVLVGGPDIGEVGKDHAAVVIVGISDKLDLPGGDGERHYKNSQEGGCQEPVFHWGVSL